ncbi:MAG: CPBP family intramembrane glutamic endopeptidase [Myxococcota bacterium]|nr:CPBP family intramembrane glutamic endopeptidase [Myxococcota bacterium]
MNAVGFISSAFIQFGVFAFFCSLCWLGHRLLCSFRKNPPTPLLKWLGIIKPSASWKDGAMVFIGLIVFGLVLQGVESALKLDSLAAISEDSPAAKAAGIASVPGAVFAGLAYAYVMTGGAEELVMRGLLYKRFIRWFGYQAANLLQSFLFAILHNLIIHLAVEDPPIAMHVLTFINLFVFSYVLGWYMEKRDGGSIFMPWFYHGFGNFKTFLVYWLW